LRRGGHKGRFYLISRGQGLLYMWVQKGKVKREGPTLTEAAALRPPEGARWPPTAPG
jgi:hypothetical protein